MTIPQLTQEERLQALQHAVEARAARAEIKAKLTEGTISLAEVIAMKDDEVIGKMRVADLISSIPHFGAVRTQKVMEELKISPSRRLRGLGKRQEVDLLERLGQ